MIDALLILLLSIILTVLVDFQLDLGVKKKKTAAEAIAILRYDIVKFASLFKINGIPWILSEKQRQLAESALKNQHTVACFGRQTGKSNTLALVCAHQLIFGNHISIGIYAPTEGQALGVMYKKVLDIFNDPFLKPMKKQLIAYHNKKGYLVMRRVFEGKQNDLRCFTANDSSNTRGFSPSIIIIDETMDISNEKYHADILPSGAGIKGGVRTRIIECGTPLGRNHFYDTLIEGIEYDEDNIAEKGRTVCIWQPYTEVAHEVWYDESLPEKAKRQDRIRYEAEYLCKWAPDFGFAFDFNDILKAATIEDFKDRRRPEGHYVGGIDIGRNRDHSVIVILYAAEEIDPTWEMVYLEQWSLDLRYDIMFEDMKEVMAFWQPDFTLIDQMNVGDLAYENYFEMLPQYTEGWKSTTTKKVELMHNLQRLFQNEKIIIWNHDILLEQLRKIPEERTLSGQPRYKKPEGGHDDQVQALAMAAMAGRELLGEDGIGEMLFEKDKKEGDEFLRSPMNRQDGMLVKRVSAEQLFTDLFD